MRLVRQLAQITGGPDTIPEYLTVAAVAAILSVSDDTILKQFGGLDGVIDIGTPATMHRRRKRVLRIPRRTLERYISDRQVKVRRSTKSVEQ